jgi:hypothetical protein
MSSKDERSGKKQELTSEFPGKRRDNNDQEGSDKRL